MPLHHLTGRDLLLAALVSSLGTGAVETWIASFNPDELANEWEWIREVENGWGVGSRDETLRITALIGTLASTRNNVRNILLMHPISHAFLAEVVVEFDCSEVGEQAGIILYEDDDDYVAVVRRCDWCPGEEGRCRTREVYLVGEVDGIPLEETALFYGGGATNVRIALRKEGDVVSAYRHDTLIGQVQLPETGNGFSRVGLIANNESNRSTQTRALFSHFTIYYLEGIQPQDGDDSQQMFLETPS